MQCDFRKRQKMVKSIKNQTLPAEKNQRDKDAGICERENLVLVSILKEIQTAPLEFRHPLGVPGGWAKSLTTI